MRSIWKGAISFGLVTIPVGLYPATENKRPKFRQLRESDHSRIKYKRTAEADGEEVPFENIVKGYEFEKGRYVVFTSEELSDVMKGISGGTVTVNSFVDETEIDPIYYRTSYYLAPEETRIKAYHILRDALRDKGVVGLATVAIREREYLASIRADEDVIIQSLQKSHTRCVVYDDRDFPGIAPFATTFPKLDRHLQTAYRRAAVFSAEGGVWYGLVAVDADARAPAE